VVEPGRRSIETAQTIIALANDLGVENIGIVGNKIRNDSDKEFITAALPDIELLGFIPYDQAINEADLANRPLFSASPQAAEAVRDIYNKLLTTNQQLKVKS
jgi:CO dehydrogenase maturation factor